MALKSDSYISGCIILEVMLLSILIWNVRGVMSSSFSLSNMLDTINVDFAILSEHKLLPQSKAFLESIHINYSSYANVDSSLDPYTSYTRGKGGIGILYKKSLGPVIRHIDDMQSDRLLFTKVKVEQSSPLYLISAYMPAENNLTYYSDTLFELQMLVEFYSSQGKVMGIGDLNAQIPWPCCKDPASGSVYKSRKLFKMVHSYNLISLELTPLCTGPCYSFIPLKAMIDHILVDGSIAINATQCWVISDSDLVVTSDYFPLIATISLWEPTPPKFNLNKLDSQIKKMVSFGKITPEHINRYQNHIEGALDDLDENET